MISLYLKKVGSLGSRYLNDQMTLKSGGPIQLYYESLSLRP